MRKTLGYAVILSAAMVLILGMPGCPPPSKGHVAVLLSGDLNAGVKTVLAKAGDIDLEQIAALVVTLTEISLDRSGNPEPEGEGSAGANDNDSKVIVFSGAVDIDLRDLTGISELITTADIPAGTYTKIRLSIENPRMTLVAEPEVIITDIQTTANGRLFVSSSFEVPEGQDSLILLDFQGLHLVGTGGGKFVWTPQLRAEISVEPADVRIQALISSVDSTADTMMVLPGSGSELVLVRYAGATIYLPADTDTPTGTEAGLVANAQVIIEGELTVTGEVHAEVIWILPVTETR